MFFKMFQIYDDDALMKGSLTTSNICVEQREILAKHFANETHLMPKGFVPILKVGSTNFDKVG